MCATPSIIKCIYNTFSLICKALWFRALVKQFAQPVLKIDLMPSSVEIWSTLRAVVSFIGVCRCLDLMSPSSVMETNCTVVIICILLQTPLSLCLLHKTAFCIETVCIFQLSTSHCSTRCTELLCHTTDERLLLL